MTTPFFDFPEGHRPRRGQLMASGIILVLLGLGAGLLSVLYLVMMPTLMGSAMSTSPPPAGPGMPTPASMASLSKFMVLAGVVFGVLSVVLLATGGGSMFLKRWSRPLSLFIAVVWLLTGLNTLVMNLLTSSNMRKMMAEEFEKAAAAGGGAGSPAGMPGPEAFFGIMMVITLAMTFIFGVILPAVVLWLNWHRDVKVTLDFCDPKPRWTDRCPAPVLGIALAAAFMALCAPTMVMMPTFPLFGKMVGPPVSHLFIGGAFVVLAAIAWGAYRCHPAAWAGALVVVITFGASWVVSSQDLDLWREVYASMGFDEVMIEQSMKSLETFLSPGVMWTSVVLYLGPTLAFLFWTRRFFGRPAEAA